MLDKLKEFFKGFDARMAEVEVDIKDLANLESQVRKEFDDIKEDMSELKRGVDKAVADKTPEEDK